MHNCGEEDDDVAVNYRHLLYIHKIIYLGRLVVEISAWPTIARAQPVSS
jgi:hypothetical protein